MRIIGAIAVVVLASCTPPEEVVLPEPERVETCDGLVEAGVTYIEAMVEALPGQPIDVITGQSPMPERLAAVAEVGRDLDLQAAKLGCDVEQLNADIAAEVDEIESDEPVVQIFLALVREGVIGALPPPPTTTVAPTTVNAP